MFAQARHDLLRPEPAPQELLGPAARGAAFLRHDTVFDELRKELGELSDSTLLPLADKVRVGIERIEDVSVALLRDPAYALLSARSVAEMVIHVIVGTELLRQAQASSSRFDLAASWVNRKMLELEMYAARVGEGDAARIERCEKIIALWD